MKNSKEPFLSSLSLITCILVISLFLTTPMLSPTPIAYAEALATTASAPTIPTIMGGQPAEVGEWPWQAVVMVGSNFCSGVLIHREWLLTAAHCLYYTDEEMYPTNAIQVTLGDYYLYTGEASEQHKTVDRVLVHPNLNFVTFDNDIALLHLTTPAIVNQYVAPIAIARTLHDDDLVVPGALATVIGWGATKENGGLSPLLREVEVPLLANTDCHQSYGMLTDNMICAGYVEGIKDACQGDSGGPLMVPDETGRWKLTGLVSFGYGCGRPLFYGVYTRVTRYLDWIEATTGSLETPVGVTDIELTITPTMVPTGTVTAVATDIAITPTASPTPLPISTTEPQPSPTRSETYISTAQNFLPVVYR